jgi:hypothetical protein
VAAALLLALGLGSCLNPISFDESMLPTIKVDVSGTIKIDDVAVFWLINRTKNVDISEFNMDRQKLVNEADADYYYPKNVKGMPGPGTSLASYHTPTETVYQIRVSYKIQGSDTTGTIELAVQLPRAQDYRYYLYWTTDGNLVLVNEDRMQTLPPDPDENWPDPQPSSVNAHTLVVINTTADQNLNGIQFVKNNGGSIYLLQNKPRAKDQAKILLSSGDFETTAFYTRNGPKQTAPKTTVITQETSSMAAKTNYLYFYKTTDGSYSLSPSWPPIPNDASKENRPEDALADDQGILEITNNAIPQRDHDLIGRVNINGDEYFIDDNDPIEHPYMVPGDVNTYILPVGTAYVSFKPTDQTYYGQTIPRQIISRSVTRLSYTNSMGNPDFIPKDVTGYGAGLIRIINKTTGVVGSVTIYDKTDLSKSLSIPYTNFTPPYPVQYSKVGRVAVYGTNEFPLTSGPNQIIQVLLETNSGMVVVEQIASLRGEVVDVVIEDGKLNPANRIGSKVTINNQTTTSTNIVGMYVYNQDNAAASAVYYMDILNPGSKSVYVLSTTGLPIVENQTYKATLSVYGNGRFALIEKEFKSDGKLYSMDPDNHTRTITLVQSDLPPELVEDFKPVTGITITPDPYIVNVYYKTGLDGVSNPVVMYSGDFNLKNVVTVVPANATTKGPIEWTLHSGGDGKVTINSDGSFRVDKGDRFVPAGTERTVKVDARIRNAAGTVTNKSDYTGTIIIQLVYQHIGYTTQKVNNFTLTSAAVELEEHDTLDMRDLVESISPPGANNNGVPITANNLTWSLVGNARGSSNFGSVLTAGTQGTITVRAVMAGGDTTSGSPITRDKNITITQGAPAFVGITDITMQDGFSDRLNYYTKTVGSKEVYASDTLALGVKFNPANATNKSPLIWSLSSGATSAVNLSSGPDQLKVKLGYSIPAPNSVVRVRVRVPNGLNINTDYISPEFPITLVEHHFRPVQPGEITLKTGEIKVNETISLNTLVTGFPSAAVYDNVPLTVADLVWSIDSGSGYGSLSSDKLALTGTAAGMVLLRATLPAGKNLENEITATTTINVQALPPVYPKQVTLRVFKVREADDSFQDTIVGIYAGMASYPDAYLPSVTEAIKRSGHTGLAWANESEDVTHFSKFKTYYLLKYYQNAYRYFDNLNIADGGYADITIDWPDNGYTGYNLFFNEGDSRVRGYVTPYELDPPQSKNYVFYLDFKYVYDNCLLPMIGNKEANDGDLGAMKVIPIYYNSYRNVGATMKSRGVGNAPVADYTGIVKK